jgi:hypothetical protein
LFQREVIKHLPFSDINRDCIPVFAISSSIKMGDMWVTRHQVPMSPAFALTEYKVQSSTYRNAVLDLSQHSKPRTVDASHKRNCSFNVQLSRLQSFDGVHLLEPLTLDDLNHQPHPELRDEDHRLQQLAALTMRLEMERP